MSTIFDHRLITERYFFPRPDALDDAVEIEVDGATLKCASHRPHGGDAPLLVHFHGNGEVAGDYVPDVAELFAKAGLDTFFVEYRGYGRSSGVPGLARMLGDVGRVLGALDVPRERTFVYGRSIGSIYAIEAAHREPGLGGLILESGIADPLERVLLRVSPEELGVTREALEAEAKACFDHEGKLGAFPGPVLVLHAANDGMVDRTHAERNARWARRSELVLFPRGDHNSILAYNLPAIVERVRRLALG